MQAVEEEASAPLCGGFPAFVWGGKEGYLGKKESYSLSRYVWRGGRRRECGWVGGLGREGGRWI